MKNLYFLIIFLISLYACRQETGDTILVFSKTTRYYHESIPAGIAAIQKLGKQHNFKVDTTTDASVFNTQNLKKYDAVVFFNTTGNDLLDSMQRLDFQKYIRSGGGFVGVHSASAAEKNWPWYGKLVGAVFTDHPEPQVANVVIIDKGHAATHHLSSPWKWNDEWYNFQHVPENVNVLLGVDETTYKGGKHGDHHPLAWYHDFEGGRSFYTALGHFDASYKDNLYLHHLAWGINYAIGKN